MHFKLGLHEMRYEDIYSWLSPKGEFHPVKHFHNIEASDLAGIQDSTEARDHLFNTGWMRITGTYNTLYANSDKQIPNDSQKASLIRLATDRNMKSIEYDNNKRSVIIWSQDDQI